MIDETATRAASAHLRRREGRAVESFQSAASCIGPVTPGMSVFAVTRGQFGAVDVVSHLLSEIGPANVSIWTWCIAAYELEVMIGLLQRGDILSGRLVIDQSSDKRNPEFIESWRQRFGADAVRITRSHAKLYRVWNDCYRLLCRGSFNLNWSPRLEQLDLDEGSAAFDLVAGIEAGLAVLPRNYSSADVMASGRLDKAFPPEVLSKFINPGGGGVSGAKNMAALTRDEVVAALVARGAPRDRAAMYAALYVTFHEADANVSANGAVVANPRTGAPLVNPYLAIRDKALDGLRRIKGVNAAFLW